MKSIYKILFKSFILVCAFCFIFINPIFAEKVEDLKVDKYVNDFASIIDDTVESELNTELYNFFASTTNQIIVVTVHNMDGDYIENYTIKLGELIRAGSEKNDNGVILLVSVEDRKVRIEVGYGLEGNLTDLKSSKIIDNIITPAFKKGDYTSGIRGGVTEIINYASDAGYESEVMVSSGLKAFAKIPFEVIMFIFFIGMSLIQWLVAILARTKSWWLGGVVGLGIGGILAFIFANIIASTFIVVFLTSVGLLIDYVVSRNYKSHISGQKSGPPDWWAGGSSMGGGWSSSSSGGYSGGGGSFGGGGSSGSW